MTNALPTGFLLLPAADDRTLAGLGEKLSTLAHQTLTSLPPQRLGSLQGPFARLQRWLELATRGPARANVLRALRGVEVLGPTLALRGACLDPRTLVARLAPSLIATVAQAWGSESATELHWPEPFSELIDPARQLVHYFDPPATSLSVARGVLKLSTSAGNFDLALAGGPARGVREQAFFAIEPGGGPLLALADANPLAMLEEHPDKAGNAISLGGRSTDDWLGALGDALSLVRFALPALATEMTTSLQRIVPVGFDTERHLSASYREAPGLIYLTLHPSALTLAEALIHETQHGKLNALSWFDLVLENAHSTWTDSPVRPDLRPLWGVLLAAHAFVPVAALHRRLAELGHPLSSGDAFTKRRADVLAANADALRTLGKLARPTPVGARVLAALRELHATLERAAPTGASSATVGSLG